MQKAIRLIVVLLALSIGYDSHASDATIRFEPPNTQHVTTFQVRFGRNLDENEIVNCEVHINNKVFTGPFERDQNGRRFFKIETSFPFGEILEYHAVIRYADRTVVVPGASKMANVAAPGGGLPTIYF